jgi:hypothetical protein
MIPYIGLLTLGAAMFAWDARKAPPAPPAEERLHLPREFRPRKDFAVRDRLALRLRREAGRG